MTVTHNTAWNPKPSFVAYAVQSAKKLNQQADWTVNWQILLSEHYKVEPAEPWTINRIEPLCGDPLSGFDCNKVSIYQMSEIVEKEGTENASHFCATFANSELCGSGSRDLNLPLAELTDWLTEETKLLPSFAANSSANITWDCWRKWKGKAAKDNTTKKWRFLATFWYFIVFQV